MPLSAVNGFLTALGWALLSSLWQFALCWLLYHIITVSSNRIPASLKHCLALAALFLGTFLFTFQFAAKWSGLPLIDVTANSRLFEDNMLVNAWSLITGKLNAFMPYWSLFYLICILLLFVKLFFLVRRTAGIRHIGIVKISAVWRLHIEIISQQMGIHQKVRAFLSEAIDTPQVIGFFKPVILIPAACLTSLTTEQLEAVLLHELVHIKRNDYLLNLFVAGIEVLFFFNPFVKQLTAQIRKEREYSCDDEVLQHEYPAGPYAAALLTLEKNRVLPATFSMAASGKNEKQLLTRIERIVGINRKPANAYPGAAALLIFLLLIFVAGMHPSRAVIDKFEAGSIGFANNNITALHYNSDARPQPAVVIAPFVTARAVAAITSTEERVLQLSIASRKKTASASASTARPVSINLAEADDDKKNVFIDASDKEVRDFSLSEKVAAEMPSTPAAEEPFVPSNSFSFQMVQDTGTPKIKGETLAERNARESLLRTQKAMLAINWQKLEKNSTLNRHTLASIQKELARQLQKLNWQQINADAQKDIREQQNDQWNDAVRQDQVIKHYQQNEVYLEALQKKITDQQRFIILSDQHLLETQNSLQQQQKKIQLDMKKRRIIYI